MLGTSCGVKELEGTLGNPGFSSSVQAVCDYFGPTDLVHLLDQQAKLPMPPGNASVSSKNFIEWLLAGQVAQHLNEAKDASPLTYVSSHSPPFFIVHGDRDTTVPLEQSKQLFDALRKDHVSAALKIIPGAEHGTSAFPPDVANDVDPILRHQFEVALALSSAATLAHKIPDSPSSVQEIFSVSLTDAE